MLSAGGDFCLRKYARKTKKQHLQTIRFSWEGEEESLFAPNNLFPSENISTLNFNMNYPIIKTVQINYIFKKN